MSIPAAKPTAAVTGPPERGMLETVLRRMFRSKTAVLGLVIVLLFLIAAVFAPQIAPYDPDKTEFTMALKPPSGTHWLGHDELGRDLLSRMIFGARISMMIGLISVTIGMLIGVPVGLIAGFYGGWVDMVISRLLDVMLSFPNILLAIFLMAILGPSLGGITLFGFLPGTLVSAMVAVGIASVPTYARLVRGSTMAVKEEDYVTAARAAGAADLRLIFKHVLRNVAAPILVQSSLQTAGAILTAAALGFLGLGAPPNIPEWGTMLQKGRTYVFSAPHLTALPGLAIMLVVLGFNLLGDGLRDALDPRLKQ